MNPDSENKTADACDFRMDVRLTPDVMHGDHHGSQHLPRVSKRTHSQLLIGTDTWEIIIHNQDLDVISLILVFLKRR